MRKWFLSCYTEVPSFPIFLVIWFLKGPVEFVCFIVVSVIWILTGHQDDAYRSMKFAALWLTLVTFLLTGYAVIYRAIVCMHGHRKKTEIKTQEKK